MNRDRELNQRNAKREAWREWSVNDGYRGGNLSALESAHGMGRRPAGWFVREELGFGTGSGPSLTLTLSRLDETNDRHAQILMRAHDAPKRLEEAYKARRQKRVSAKRRAAKFDQLVKRATKGPTSTAVH